MSSEVQLAYVLLTMTKGELIKVKISGPHGITKHYHILQ